MGDACGDGQHTGTAAEKDTEAQLNAINKTFIQTITQYRAHFSLAFKKGFSALYNVHTGFARLGFPPHTHIQSFSMKYPGLKIFSKIRTSMQEGPVTIRP